MPLTETENKKQLYGRKQNGFCFRSARLDACEICEWNNTEEIDYMGLVLEHIEDLDL